MTHEFTVIFWRTFNERNPQLDTPFGVSFPPMPAASIIIPNFNGKLHLQRLLPSLFTQSETDIEVIVVDNGSSDGSVEWVQRLFPHVFVLPHRSNEGFALACNRGIANAHSENLIILNNDTVVEPEFVRKMLEAATGTAVGMVAAKVYHGFEGNILDSVGLQLHRNGMGTLIGHGEPDQGQWDDVIPFAPSGVAALYKRQMLDQVGRFDANFFAYYEDLDLGFRARLAGWQCVSAPQAIVRHEHSATSHSFDNAFKIYYLHRNKLWMIIKNYPAHLLVRYLVNILFYDLLAATASICRDHTLAGIRARWDAVKAFPQRLRQRRQIQRGCTLPHKELEHWFQPSGSPTAYTNHTSAETERYSSRTG